MYGVLMIDIDSTALTAEDVSLIKQAQVGGVILFARNVADAVALPDYVRVLRHYRRWAGSANYLTKTLVAP